MPTDSRRMLLCLLQNLPGMVFRCGNDPRWTMEFVSDGARPLTGYGPEDLVGGAVEYGDLIHPADQAEVWDAVQAALAERRPWRMVYRIRTASGGEKLVREQGWGVLDDEGGLRALEGFVADVTDRRELREQLQQAQKMEAIGLLAGGIAHDFNNLLTVIRGNSDILLAGLPPEDPLHARAAGVRAAAERASELTRRLLAFSRRQAPDLQPLDLNEVIMETRSLLDRLMGARVRIEADLAADLAFVRADASQLSQVLVNLAVNARDAMPEGGVLRFSTWNRRGLAGAPDRVMLDVADTGTGIPPEIRSRIFEPFFTTKGRDRGTGLGLSMVHGILLQTGGGISVESEPGRGATFRISLPAIPRPAPADPPPATGPLPFAGTATILLVEDDPGVRELAAAILRADGFVVHPEPDGPAALLRAGGEAGGIDLLLTDLGLPGMPGRDLARRLRERRPGLPVVLMSGEGGAGILEKPFSADALLDAVRQALAGGGPEAEEA